MGVTVLEEGAVEEESAETGRVSMERAWRPPERESMALGCEQGVAERAAAAPDAEEAFC